jgi:hypothetical protein
MHVKEIPNLLHASVDLLHASPNMLLDGRYVACTVKYVACTENTLHAILSLMNGESPVDRICYMRVKEIPDLLHVSVRMLHAMCMNMLLDGIYAACMVKYVACTENTQICCCLMG